MINAEGGEYIVNRSSTMKYKPLIDAINRDDRLTIDRLYMRNIKGSRMNHRVSLDDSKDLRAIREIMERSGKTVEYISGYRIEKFGNVVTRIKMSAN